MPTEVVALAAQAAHSPAFRIRVVLPGQALEDEAVRIRPLPLFTGEEARVFASGSAAARLRTALGARRRLARQVRELDGAAATVLLQRQADLLPFLTIERSACDGRRLVLDVDDAIWHDGSAGGHPLARLKGSRRKVDWLARRADVCVAGNDVLAEYLAERSDDVRVIPSLVDVDSVPLRVHEDSDPIVLGWIGSATTIAFLERMRATLERIGEAIAPRRGELLVVGGTIAPVRGLATTLVPWSEAAERDALARMDIGLMPIDDTPFTRGKCAYKALQYMAAGIPAVADDVGISAQVIGDRKGGLIAGSPDAWVDAVSGLASDATLRARLGAEGRRRVVEGYSYERWIPEIAAVLRGD